MSTINSWKAFIKAQEIFVNQYSEPFKIFFKNSDQKGLGYFEIDQVDPLANIRDSLNRSFPGIAEEDINIKEGYLLYDSTKAPIHTEKLAETAAANYFDYNHNPCFSGYVILKNSPYTVLRDVCELQSDLNGQALATLAEINRIDEKLDSIADVNRSPAIGGVFKVQMSSYYIEEQFSLIHSYLTKQLGIDAEAVKNDANRLIIENFFLKETAINHIEENSGWRKTYHRLTFTIKEDCYLRFLRTKHQKKIFFVSEKNTEQARIILPELTPQHEIYLTYDSNISLVDLHHEIFHFKAVCERYFGVDSYSFKHQHIFQINDDAFFEHFHHSIHDHRFNVSIDSETISFDFIDEPQLKSGLEYLSSLKIANIVYKGVEHRFKIKLNHVTPLVMLQAHLHEIPAIKSSISPDGLKLSFFCFFNSHDLLQLLVSNITDKICQYLSDGMDFGFDELRENKLKYFLHFRQGEYETEIKSRFNYLLGEEIYIYDPKKPKSFGVIEKVKYPDLVIKMESIQDEGFTLPTTVCCTLKGERDKLKRLADTISIIFSDNLQKIPNNKLRSILMNSSEALCNTNNVTTTPEYAEVIKAINTSLMSETINDRQKETIAKSLMAEDFFIIQGPPGTGKSTAIAELIWQHIRSNITDKKEPYRVLVTSETNLAVDNALDKLRNKNHLLVKPLRLGSEDKMDKEGKRFSLESLRQWSLSGNYNAIENNGSENILKDWITIICNRSRQYKCSENNAVLERWHSYLSDTKEEVRKVFFESYIEHANVIGATCSSIGKENSENKFTRFFSDYCSIVNPKAFSAFRSSINSNTKNVLKKINIEFDLVVQDEASKASPPELALPCLFGKKAIVIGDHRQLPPMVDTKEFIDTLTMMATKTRDEANKNEINTLIRYIKKNQEEFSISHFEKLFNAIHPNLKSSFNVQYRMHPAINDTIRQFYIEDGGLECGIPGDIVDSDDMSHPLNRFHGITQNKNTHVIWLDVDSPELKTGTSRINHGEIKAIDWLLASFQKSPGYKKFIDYWPPNSIEEKQIGIITFYGAQASLLNKLSEKYPEIPLRISPVDRFQGMERNIVIVSLVRSDSIAEMPNQKPNFETFPKTGFPLQNSLGFAEFPNRLNVALSRAKRLLIIVGNSRHFRQHKIYDKVYETIRSHPNGIVKSYDLNLSAV